MSTESAAPAARPSRAAVLLAMALPALAAALVYARVLGATYVHVDDPSAVITNPALTGAGGSLVRVPGLVAPSPMGGLSLALDNLRRGDTALAEAARTFHVTSFALHLLAVILVVGFALRLRMGAFAAALAGFLFALHPVVVEPVAWITARSQLLAAVFALGALNLAWAGRPRLALAVAMLAVASHPVAAFVPVVLAFGRPEGARPRGFVLVNALASVVLWATLLGALGRAYGASPLGERALRMPVVLGTRVAAVLWPPSIDTLPLRPTGPALYAFGALGLGAALVALALLAVGARRDAPRAPWIGLLLATATTCPTLGLIPVERPWNASHLYLPFAGIALGAAAVIGSFAGRLVQRVALVAALALSFGSTALADAYKSSDALVSGSRRVKRGSPEELLERARALYAVGNLRDSARVMRQSEAQFPAFAGHLRLKGDVFRYAGRKREAYWAYVFAVRAGDESVCATLVNDTLAEKWEPGAGEAAELARCLGRVMPDLMSAPDPAARQRALELARRVGYVPR